MNQTSNVTWAKTDQNRQISAIFAEQRSRLRNFIRRRVPDPRDAEDILQDAFYKLVEANRLLMPIDHVTSWLFRVARNRITDLRASGFVQVGISSGNQALTRCAFRSTKSAKDYCAAKGLPRTAV
jgi:RNA polymerase sigma factor (sigma-70 family)